MRRIYINDELFQLLELERIREGEFIKKKFYERIFEGYLKSKGIRRKKK